MLKSSSLCLFSYSSFYLWLLFKEQNTVIAKDWKQPASIVWPCYKARCWVLSLSRTCLPETCIEYSVHINIDQRNTKLLKCFNLRAKYNLFIKTFFHLLKKKIQLTFKSFASQKFHYCCLLSRTATFDMWM